MTAGPADIGWEEYFDLSGTLVAADPDGIVNDIDIDDTDHKNWGAFPGAAIDDVQTIQFSTKEPVTLTMTAIAPLALGTGDSVTFLVAYVVD